LDCEFSEEADLSRAKALVVVRVEELSLASLGKGLKPVGTGVRRLSNFLIED